MLNISEQDYEKIQSMMRNVGGKRNDTVNEVEVRFGRFIQRQQGKTFVSDVGAEVFFRLKKHMSKAKYSSDTLNTIEHSYKSDGGNIKHIKINGEVTSTKSWVLKKQVFYHNIFEHDMRFAFSTETPTSPLADTNTLDSFVREKQRTTYHTPVGKLDMTIVTEGQSTNKKYEVELEIASQNMQEVFGFINFILQIRQDNYNVVSNSEKMAVMAEYEHMMKKRFFVGGQPVTLQKNDISTLYKNLYSVTDKVDGERTLMIINQYKQAYIVDNNMQNMIKTNLVSSRYHSCVLDGELVRTDTTIQFLAFDMLCYGGKDVRGNDKYLLKTRLDRLNDIVQSIESNQFYGIKMKQFFFRNVFMGSETLLRLAKDQPYKNDGLIFTPMNEVYPTARAWPTCFKWKPAELNSIDFFAVKGEDNTWQLYVQHTIDQTKTTQAHEKQLVPFNVQALCHLDNSTAITHQTTFDDSLIDPTTGETYKSHTVIEFKWDKDASKFVPLRTRWDKTANPNKHGNFSAVACDIWNNIHNPIEEELLFRFTTTNKQDFFFERMRKFHNKVKEMLYNKYTNNCEYLLELCSGKGGDLHKWLNNNVKHVVGYDISDKAIKECEKRVETTNSRYNLISDFHTVDLCSPEAVHVVSTNARRRKFDVVSCQFGVHYFFQAQQTFQNLVEILKQNLKEGGVFMVTFMDNEQLEKLFVARGGAYCDKSFTFEQHNNEIAYLMKTEVPMNKDVNSFGSRLRIVLNGNNVLTEGSNEFIINFQMFVKLMKEHGFHMTETKLFSEMVDIQFELTDVEKKISFLNRYCVFTNGTTKASDNVDGGQVRDVFMSSDPQMNPLAKTLFEFDNIDLCQNNTSVHKVSSKYDIIDALNCIEYKVYKQTLDDKVIEDFDDITEVVSKFSSSTHSYTPMFVQNPLCWDDYPICETSAVYFTHHKHTVERKVDNIVEQTEFDNWYIIMYKNKIIFNPEAIKNVQRSEEDKVEETVPDKVEETVPNKVEETVPDKVDETVSDKVEENKVEENNTKENDEKSESTVRMQQVLDVIQGKVTVKMLKEYLVEFGLKTSGNKNELVTRLEEYLKK